MAQFRIDTIQQTAAETPVKFWLPPCKLWITILNRMKVLNSTNTETCVPFHKLQILSFDAQLYHLHRHHYDFTIYLGAEITLSTVAYIKWKLISEDSQYSTMNLLKVTVKHPMTMKNNNNGCVVWIKQNDHEKLLWQWLTNEQNPEVLNHICSSISIS